MSTGPIRRAQLIAPFGPGAMHVLPSGVSVICSGLDYWFKGHDRLSDMDIDQSEYSIDEWRLSERLGVDDFYFPPDYRKKGDDTPNSIPNYFLTIPFLRFPRWHYCHYCGFMDERTLQERESRIPCPSCNQKNKVNYLVQVPIVAMCDEGHIQDFPWREWLFKTCHLSDEQRKIPIFLVASGGTTLADQHIRTKDGDIQRNLAGIMEADNNDTKLTRTLCSNERYTCCGKMPWLGEYHEHCDRPIRGSLRNATNVYFAQISSSIYLPKDLFEGRNIPQEVAELLSEFQKNKLLITFRKNRKQQAYSIEELKLNASTLYSSYFYCINLP